MLILVRRRGEEIQIGQGADTIRIRILDISGGNVRLGITAPRHVRVDRREVAEARARGPARATPPPAPWQITDDDGE